MSNERMSGKDFSDMIKNGESVSDAVIYDHVNIKNVALSKPFLCNNLTFEGGVWIGNSIFSRAFGFRESRFSKGLSINRSLFTSLDLAQSVFEPHTEVSISNSVGDSLSCFKGRLSSLFLHAWLMLDLRQTQIQGNLSLPNKLGDIYIEMGDTDLRARLEAEIMSARIIPYRSG